MSLTNKKPHAVSHHHKNHGVVVKTTEKITQRKETVVVAEKKQITTSQQKIHRHGKEAVVVQNTKITQEKIVYYKPIEKTTKVVEKRVSYK